MSLAFRSQSKGYRNTGCLSELNKAEFVFSRLVWILLSIPDSEINNDSALVNNFKEILQACQIYLVYWMNPNSSVKPLLVQVFYSLELVN